jgi:prevent-host-death family protein
VEVPAVVKKVSALKARQNLGRLLEEVYSNDDQYVIERAGQPVAAVVPIWQLREWSERQQRVFSMIDEVRGRNANLSPETVDREVKEAVQSVRKARARKR